MRPTPTLPQNDQTGDHEKVRACVEDAIPQRIDFQIGHAVGRVAGAGQHVMPLKQLMKHDPIEKPAEPKAEQNPGANREIARFQQSHGVWALAD
jgi:hypothetical protein